jgi:hypothetical protein
MTWDLDAICRLTAARSLLDALHACRAGQTADRPWLTAWLIARHQPSYLIPGEALAWLARQAHLHDDARLTRTLVERAAFDELAADGAISGATRAQCAELGIDADKIACTAWWED